MSPQTWRSDDEALKEIHVPKDQIPEGGKTVEKERPPRRRGLVLFIIIALIALLVLAIALGVGLGVGLTRNRGSKSPR